MGRTQSSDGDSGPSITARLKNAALTGLALIIPLVVTILVLTFVWGFIASMVEPISNTLGELLGLTGEAEQVVLLGLTTVGLAILIVLIGLGANLTSRTGIEAAFDRAIEAIPGVGAIYSTFRDMSELLLDSDSQSFEEVVLVEYPNEDTYCVAFLTRDTPQYVLDTVGKDEMITVFMPMGPNPFMGGFVLHVSEERVYDIDMSVEEGIESIITSGAAMGEHDDAPDTTPPDDATTIEHGSPGAKTPGDDPAALSEDEPLFDGPDDKEGA